MLGVVLCTWTCLLNSFGRRPCRANRLKSPMHVYVVLRDIVFVEGSLLGLLRLSYLFALCLLFRLGSAVIFLCLDADMFCSFYLFFFLISIFFWINIVCS